MTRRTLTVSLLGLAAGAAFAAPRLMPAMSLQPPMVPEVRASIAPVVVVDIPVAPPVQVPVPPTPPLEVRVRNWAIPELQEMPPPPVAEERPVTRPDRTIPELDEPVPQLQLPVDPPVSEVPMGCGPCGRG